MLLYFCVGFKYMYNCASRFVHAYSSCSPSKEGSNLQRPFSSRNIHFGGLHVDVDETRKGKKHFIIHIGTMDSWCLRKLVYCECEKVVYNIITSKTST